MSDHFLFAGIGAVLGFLLGGWVVGSMCGKEYRKKIDALQTQNRDISFENRKLKEQELKERKSIVDEAEAKLLTRVYGYSEGDNEEINEDNDELVGDVEFDDPFHGEGTWNDNDIYLIDAEEFEGDLETRDNETLTWYCIDGVLTDDHNDKIDDVEKVVGKDFVETVKDTDKDFLYISNEIEDKMYEVIVDRNQSFYRDILGVR